jgi:hypothetical protein
VRVREITELVAGELIQENFNDTEITACYTSDLLSDVMAHAGDATVLITIQAHKNTVAVASLNDIRAIVVCNNRPVPLDMVSSAADEGIAVVKTPENQFTVSGKLYVELNGAT